jgi:cell shape-determining protein MreC
MLLSGINRTTDTVFLEILSYEDLVKTGEKLDRLFLVVTYAVAFDRVYYPLPLELKKDNTTQELGHEIRIVQDIHGRGKKDINDSRATPDTHDRLIRRDRQYAQKQEECFLLQEENEKLKKELKITKQEVSTIHDRLKLISKDMNSTNQNKSHKGLKNVIEDLNVL